jgi:hypothetical protein
MSLCILPILSDIGMVEISIEDYKARIYNFDNIGLKVVK